MTLVESMPTPHVPDGQTALPLTAAQLGIWNAQRLEPDSPYYVVGDVLEITGSDAVDIEAIRTAITRTVAEADSLRLRLHLTDDGPVQWISDEPLDPPQIIDLRGESDPHAAAEAAVTAERSRLAAECVEMVDRALFGYRILWLSDTEVWYTQMGHHLVFDGYSAAMLSRRAAAHYTAIVNGTDVAASKFGSFAEFVAADVDYRSSEQLTQDRDYWRDEMTPLPPLPERPAEDGPATNTRTARTELPEEVFAALRRVADEAGATWGEALIGCYAAFLHRALGESDVVFAMPLMCRVGGVALRTPAMAVNVLPLRVTVHGGDRLTDLSARVADVMRRMRTHQRYRGEDLPRDLAAPNVGSVLHGRGINLKAFDLTLAFAGSSGVMRNVAGGPPEDYGLSVIPTVSGGLLVGFEVDARAATQEQVDARLHAVVTLVTELTGETAPSVAQVRLLDDARRADLIGRSASAESSYSPRTVPEALNELALRSPDAPALVHDQSTATVTELAQQVHKLARLLRSHEVGADDVVALALPRSTSLVVALLAVLDAGAAYQYLDPAYPSARHRELVADSRPTLVLADSAASAPQSDDPSRLITLDDPAVTTALDAFDGGPLSDDELSAPRHPDHLAYVIHTSGSTGRPKGVAARVGGLTTLLRHHRQTLVDVAEQRATELGRTLPLHCAHTYSFSFDASIDQLLWLVNGHTLHLYSTDTSRDAQALLTAYAQDRIDVVDTTPSMAAPLIDAGLTTGPHPPAILILGGEATGNALWRTLSQGSVPAVNLYGPTEAAVDATAAAVTGDLATIGRAIAGTAAYILDGALEPVTDGEVGELYLAGPHLARGYLNLPAATAERFVADPYGRPGSRMYRTGDRVRCTAAGDYEYLGRADSQVKIRGFRIELAEVEAALAAVSDVTSAAAIVRSEGGRDRLVGYVTGPITPEQVRDRLTAAIPDHMIPSAIVVLDELPVTINGKLDRAALPAPVIASEGRGPRTDRERILCAVVAEAFDVPEVSIDDDFFSLGGDSISAITVCSDLRARGLTIRPRDFLSGNSFAALAAAAAEPEQAPAVPVADAVGQFPAPPIVAALLTANPAPEQINGYAQWVAPEVPQGATTARLGSVLDALVEAHPALRLRVGADGDLLIDTQREPITVTESAASDGDLPTVAAAVVARLDARAGTVVAAQLVRSSEGAADRLVLAIHHLAVDGVSWRILLADLATAYRDVSTGAAPAIRAEATPWRAHALALADAAAGGEHRGEMDHWRAAIRDAVRLGERPVDPDTDQHGTAAVTVTTIDAAESTAVTGDLARAYRSGADDCLLAALALAVRLHSGPRNAATVTVEGHGREDVLPGSDLARTVGWFTTEYPVRLPLDVIESTSDLDEALAGGPAAGRLVQAVKEAKRAVPAHGIGFGILRHFDPQSHDDMAAAAPDIVFNYLGSFTSGGEGWTLPDDTPFAVSEPETKALEQVLAINCFDTAHGLTVEWTAASKIVSADIVEALSTHWSTAITALAAHARALGPDGGGLTPSDIPLVSVDREDIALLEDAGPISDILPATALQVGMAFHSQVLADDETDAYVVQAATHLRGSVDPDRMKDAAAELFRRIPSLRTYLGFTASADVVQVVPARIEPEFRFVDLSGEPDPSGAFAALAQTERHRRFDPAAAPLIRFLLVRAGSDHYRLTLTNHHALLDGWSMPIAGQTLLKIYAELGGGERAPRSAPLAGYYRWRAQQDPDAARAAWAEELDGVEAGTLIAPASAASSEGGSEPRQIHLALPAELSRQLDTLTRTRGITLSSVLHTAWGIVLGRITGRHDVVFGCPVSGRPDEVDDVATMVGQLGEAIAVRVRFRSDQPIAEVLADVHRRALAVSDHHHFGLVDITRTAGVGELFDSIVVTENFPTSDRQVHRIEEGLDLTGVDISDATHYPLTIVALPGENLTLGVGFRADRIDEDTARSYGRWLGEVLRRIATDPDAPIGTVGTLPAHERAAMLDLGTVAATGHYGSLLDEFGARVSEDPDHPAVVCEERQLTYAQLDAAANRVAHRLIASGVRAQDTVAVFAERDLAWYAAFLGVIRAGAVYLPLDPAYPPARLEFLLTDAAPAAVLTCGEIPTEATDPVPTSVPVLAVDVDDTSAPSSDPSFARTTLTPDSLAYIIYTSGTTGRPKGVAITHRGIPDLMAFGVEAVGFSAHERVLQTGSPSFDISVLQVLGPLMAGATSVIAPDRVRVPGPELVDYVREHAVSVVNLLPSFLAAMPDDTVVDPTVIFMVGAERLDPELADRWGRGRRALFNCYGPTEATINAVLWKYQPNDPGPLPIGRPDPNLPCYVLDDGLNPVGTGVLGELYLAGDALAQGYVHRPDLTAGTFVANPFGAPGSRMYRTGDLVAWRADGNLTFHGRADHQVKIRGLRVELGEIETALARCPGVRAAAVLVRDDRLVAYLVRNDDAEPDAEEIRGILADALPAHMVPTAYVVLDRLPLGPTGKLDRDSLPAPETARAAASRDDRAPGSEAETALLAVFQDLLETDDVRLGDDFVELGGDSLVALQVVSRARRRGFELGPRDVFDGRTIAGIAQRATRGSARNAPSGSDFEQFRAILNLSERERDVFVGVHPAKVGVHTFGGQILAQAIVASGRTVDAGTALHAAHTHFIELGSVTEDLHYRVTRLRDGRSAANRQVTVEQSSHVVAVMTLAYQESVPGSPAHNDPTPAAAAPADSPSLAESFAGHEKALRALIDASHPLEIRFASDPVWVRRDTGDRESPALVWMRTDGALPDDQVVHDAALAWASDTTIQDPIIAREGLSWGYDRVAVATLNQSLWFHERPRFDQYHLLSAHSPIAGDGRGVATGHFFRDGRLIATVTQEAVLRVLGEPTAQ